MIPVPRSLLRLAGGVAALLFAPLVLAAGQHTYGEYHVTVMPDAVAVLSESDYQVTVANEELLLSRLTAPYDGTLSNSFVADLNRDGGFEVVVTFSHPDGDESDVHVYTWDDNLLTRIDLAELGADQREGYRGNDEFAVRDGKLIRMFQVYEGAGETWEPTAVRRELRYSFEDGSWMTE